MLVLVLASSGPKKVTKELFVADKFLITTWPGPSGVERQSRICQDWENGHAVRLHGPDTCSVRRRKESRCRVLVRSAIG